MKKTFMLASLIAMTAVASGTTGKVYLNTGTESKFEKTKQEHKIAETKIGTEVKVKDTGFSFGGEFKLKDVKGFIATPTYALATKDSNVWAKYELPEIKGINSSIKATYKETTKLNLEGDVNYTINGVKVGLNSNTTFPLKLEENKTLGAETVSEHKVYVEAKEASVLKDVKANVKLAHTYNKIEKDAKANEVLAKAVKNVSGEAEATYDKVKDLKLTGKVAFKVNIADTEIEYKNNDEKLFPKSEAKYIHSYEVTGTYTGIKNLELVANPFVAHVGVNQRNTNGIKERTDRAIYGINAKAIYKMLDEKLTLTGKTQLAGKTLVIKDSSNKEKPVIVTTAGHFVFGANAKYDHKVNDKFTVSPEFDATVKFTTDKKVIKRDRKKGRIFGIVVDTLELTLAPKVKAEYKPIENLTLKGGIELPISFSGLKKDEFYKSTLIKTSLNVEYKW